MREVEEVVQVVGDTCLSAGFCADDGHEEELLRRDVDACSREKAARAKEFESLDLYGARGVVEVLGEDDVGYLRCGCCLLLLLLLLLGWWRMGG